MSEERTGERFEELHRWIDEYQKKLGPNHRIKRHSFNTEDANEIRHRWGDRAIAEWLFHIAIDNLETSFKEAKKAYKKNNVYNYFKFGLIPNSAYIHFSCERADEQKLKAEFQN